MLSLGDVNARDCYRRRLTAYETMEDDAVCIEAVTNDGIEMGAVAGERVVDGG